MFLHRHRYWLLIPGIIEDTRTGGLHGLSRLLCSCGKEDPRLAALAVRLGFKRL